MLAVSNTAAVAAVVVSMTVRHCVDIKTRTDRSSGRRRRRAPGPNVAAWLHMVAGELASPELG